MQIILEPHDLAPVMRHGVLWITTRQDAASWQDRTGVDRIRGNRSSPFASALAKDTRCEFHKTPLKDALGSLSDLHTITLRVDPAAPDEVAKTPITLHLHGITLAEALEMVLDQHDLCCMETKDAILIRPRPPAPAP